MKIEMERNFLFCFSLNVGCVGGLFGNLGKSSRSRKYLFNIILTYNGQTNDENYWRMSGDLALVFTSVTPFNGFYPQLPVVRLLKVYAESFIVAVCVES